MLSFKDIVESINKISDLEGKKTVFLISSTTKCVDSEYYTVPIRNYNSIVVSGVVASNISIAKKAAESIDGLVDYIFVDAERKVSNEYSDSLESINIERSVREVVSKSHLISYKANDLTVDAADNFISNYFSNYMLGTEGKKVTIVGAGNIGSKIGLKLAERGCEVYLHRRNHEKLNIIVDYINNTKSKYTLAKAFKLLDINNIHSDTNVLIGATDGKAVINEDLISKLNDNVLVLDIGKGSISKGAIKMSNSRGIDIFRLSIECALEGMLVALIETRNVMSSRVGRDSYSGIKVVSGGVLAREDEFVVDNYLNPKIIYGLGDGLGDFNRNLSVDMQKSLKILQDFINKN